MPVDQQPSISPLDEAWEGFFAAVRRARARSNRQPSHGLTLAQYQLLLPLLEQDGRHCGELAVAAGVTPPTATRMLDGLERDGYVTRGAAPGDRRAVAIALTPSGRDVVEAKRAHIRARRRELFAGLSPAERRQAEQLLRRLGELVEEL